jgi:hypothetical protein
MEDIGFYRFVTKIYQGNFDISVKQRRVNFRSMHGIMCDDLIEMQGRFGNVDLTFCKGVI